MLYTRDFYLFQLKDLLFFFCILSVFIAGFGIAMQVGKQSLTNCSNTMN